MKRARIAAALTLAAILLPGAPLRAQAGAAPPAAPAATPGLPRGDVGGSIAWFHHKTGLDQYRQWQHGSRWMGVEGGYYWTENLKTEAGFAGTSEDQFWSGGGQLVIDRQVYWESRVSFMQTRRFYVTQLYQFGHNAWVHPFLGGGVQVVREQRRGLRYLYPSSPSGLNQETAIPQTIETVFKGSGVAGLKIYVSRKAFLRTDALVNFRQTVDEVVIRFGAGVDF